MKRIWIFFAIILIAGVSIFYISIQKKAIDKNTTLKTVVATTYPSYFVASQIAGDSFRLINISANAADAHDFEPTPHDVYALKTADLSIISGMHLDDWALKAESNNSVDMSKHVYIDGTNPHYWMNFENLKSMSSVITKKLSEMEPTKATEFEANNKKFISQIDTIAKEYALLKECKNKNILVSHDAFGYMSKPLGINVIAIHQSGDVHGEPSLSTMANSLQLAKSKNIKIVFYESDETKKDAEFAAKELNANIKMLFTMESAPIKDKDFIAMLKENLKNFKEAMDCAK